MTFFRQDPISNLGNIAGINVRRFSVAMRRIKGSMIANGMRTEIAEVLHKGI